MLPWIKLKTQKFEAVVPKRECPQLEYHMRNKMVHGLMDIVFIIERIGCFMVLMFCFL